MGARYPSVVVREPSTFDDSPVDVLLSATAFDESTGVILVTDSRHTIVLASPRAAHALASSRSRVLKGAWGSASRSCDPSSSSTVAS